MWVLLQKWHIVGVVLVAIAACRSKGQVGTVHQHPDRARFEFSEISLWEPAAGTNKAINRLIQRLKRAERQWHVGGWGESNPWTMFGEIGDVAQDRKGRIFVLDKENAVVRVFSSTGNYLFSIGEKGEGPGAFLYPEWLELDDYDTLYVTDRRRKIEVFAPIEERYVYYRTILLPITPSGGLCVNDSSLFVSQHTSWKDSLIYHLNKQGDLIRKFGNIRYVTENRLVRLFITRNYMICDFSKQRIFLVYRNAPVIQIYKTGGKLIDQIWIENLSLTGFEEQSDGIFVSSDGIRLAGVHFLDNKLVNTYMILKSWSVQKLFGYIFDLDTKQYAFIDSIGVSRIRYIGDNIMIAEDYYEIPNISYYTY
ncbi:6-bladed beta-propeller [Rhodothermus marinus]|uniref:6-bladed beta-propeller n=1 Tax=Rhodothermus marinus TaxID=29549 RepID=UPI0037C8B004